MDRSKLKEEALNILKSCNAVHTQTNDYILRRLRELIFAYETIEDRTEEEDRIFQSLSSALKKENNMPHSLEEELEQRMYDEER